MRVVVTGGGGFIGWHVVDTLARRSEVVQAWTRNRVANDWQVPVEAVAVEITARAAVQSNLLRFAPDVIIHLAGQSFPGRSWENPERTYEINVIGAIHLLEAVRLLTKPPRVLLVGSSAEYAEREDGHPIGEGDPTEPNSPYGASKLAVDQLVQLYVRRYSLDLVRVRPFYLTGPRKTGDVCSDFARRVVAIERGGERVMRVGSLDVVRDIMDVRDGVRAMLRIVEAGNRGDVFNVCSGQPVSIGDILGIYRRLAVVPFNIIQDPELMRPLEQKVKIGNCTKLRALGWTPQHDLNDTLRAILDYWRGQPTD